MSTNTPGSWAEGAPEAHENPKKKQEQSIQFESLVKTALEEECGSPVRVEAYDRYFRAKRIGKETILEKSLRIHEAARAARESGDANSYDDYTSIDESYIRGNQDQIDSMIESYMIRESRELIYLRKRAQEEAGKYFPMGWSEMADIGTLFSTYEVAELRRLVSYRGDMKKRIKAKYGDIIELQETLQDYSSLFWDPPERITNETERRKINNLLASLKRGTHNPSEEELSYLLSFYSKTEDRVKILTELGVRVSIPFLRSLHIYSSEELSRTAEVIARTYFAEVMDGLEAERRQDLIEIIRFDDSIEIPVSVLKDGYADSLLWDIRIQKKLSNKIALQFAQESPIFTADPNSFLARAFRASPTLAESDPHRAVLNYILSTSLLGPSGEEKIISLDTFTPGAVLEYSDTTGEKQLFELTATNTENDDRTEIWVKIRVISTGTDGVINRSNLARFISYENLATLLQRIVQESQDRPRVIDGATFASLIRSGNDEEASTGIYTDIGGMNGTIDTIEALRSRLDEIDGSGAQHGFEVGTYFETSAREKDNPNNKSIALFRVVKIEGDKIYIEDDHGNEHDPMTFTTFLSILEEDTSSFHRKNRITSDFDFVQKLSDFWLRSTSEIRDGCLLESQPENQDEHWHAHVEQIINFVNDDGGHIAISHIDSGIVYFWEFTDGSIGPDERKELNKLSGEEKEKKYTWMGLTYGAFIEYLKTHKLKKHSGKPIFLDTRKEKHLPHDHHHDHSHLHGSLSTRFFQFYSIGEMGKAVEMIVHGIEHTMEKGTKLNAARFALAAAKRLWLPASVQAQIYADVVNGSKEITGKYLQKLFDLPGPKARLKCIHIVHNKDSRPEEVMAATQYMVKSYGHLYAEDVKEFQSVVTEENLKTKLPGYYAFLDALILTTKIGGSLIEWREKCLEKSRNDVGGEWYPTEEMLIHAFMKLMDGKNEEYPYAASVVKAAGGPSGFEKDWKTEGYKNAVDKGKSQTGMVNAQWRLNKAVSFLCTHEIYKAIGSMEKVAGKVKAPEYQAVPIIFALGGYARYMMPDALQELKGYGENGLTFHGYAFLRNEVSNNLYRDTMRLALVELARQGKIGAEKISQFDDILSRFAHGPETEANEKMRKKRSQEGDYDSMKAPFAMMQFWKDTCNTGLHEMMQWENGWLMSASRTNGTIARYYRHLGGDAGKDNSIHGQMLNDPSIPGTDFWRDWHGEHGWMNTILKRDDDTGLMSLDRMLNKIKLTGTNALAKTMSDDDRMKIFQYALKKVANFRDLSLFQWNNESLSQEEAEKLQKEQFIFVRNEIIHFLQKNTSALYYKDDPSSQEDIITTHEFYQDVAKLGIDPYAIFQRNPTENAEEDYKRWIRSVPVIIQPKNAGSALDKLMAKTKSGGYRNLRPGWEPFVD